MRTKVYTTQYDFNKLLGINIDVILCNYSCNKNEFFTIDEFHVYFMILHA